jgi:hypothetical protein
MLLPGCMVEKGGIHLYQIVSTCRTPELSSNAKDTLIKKYHRIRKNPQAIINVIQMYILFKHFERGLFNMQFPVGIISKLIDGWEYVFRTICDRTFNFPKNSKENIKEYRLRGGFSDFREISVI